MNEELLKKSIELLDKLYDVFADLSTEAEENGDTEKYDFFSDKYMTCDEIKADIQNLKNKA